MCQDEIGRVWAVDRAVGSATVELGGERKDISLLAIDEGVAVDEGDWLVVFQGYALTVIDQPTAVELLAERAVADTPPLDHVPNGDEP